MLVASAAQGVHSRRCCGTIAFALPCDPLVERGLRLSGRPQSHRLCHAGAMRVQAPPSWCRSDSISPRPATGLQRSEAGRNGGPWKPRSGYPVSQASMGRAAQAKGCRAIVKTTQRKRLTRWSQQAQDTAPAVGNLTGMPGHETRWKAPPYGCEPWALGTAEPETCAHALP